MRIYSIVSAALGGVLMVGVSSTALAGSCGGGVVCNSGFNANVMPYEGVPSATCNTGLRAPMGAHMGTLGSNCNPGVVVHPSSGDPLAAVETYENAPYGYLKRFAYKNTPNVNVTRVRSRTPMVNLNDVPTGYSGGCDPAVSNYCRTRAPMPIMPAPVMPRPMPIMRVPVAPIAPAQVRIGSGYNPSNFAPRQYGDNILTPGTAHIPTSIVDRSPITHIDGVPQQKVRSVTTMNTVNGHNAPRPMMAPRPTMRPVMGRGMGGNVLGYVNGGSRTMVKPGTPDYWDKTSGATVVDGLPATQILCRRAGTPASRHTVNVVRPVIGVPTPVPTAVPVPVRPVCAPAPMAGRMHMRAPMRAPMPTPVRGGRWTY